MNEFNRLSLTKRRNAICVVGTDSEGYGSLPLSENFVRWKNLRGFHPVIRASLRPILLLVLLGCTIAVLTYATAKISSSRNNSKAAFTSPTNVDLGSLAKGQPGIGTTSGQLGANLQKPTMDASAMIGVYGRVYDGWKPDPTALESPSSLAKNLLMDLPVADKDYGIQGTTVPLHSSDYESPFAMPLSDKPTFGYYGTPAGPPPNSHGKPPSSPPISGFPTPSNPSGPGSDDEGAPSQPIIVGVINLNPANEPPVTPVPEPSWVVLAATALAFSLFGWAARAVLTRSSRERRTHSGM